MTNPAVKSQIQFRYEVEFIISGTYFGEISDYEESNKNLTVLLVLQVQ